MISSIVFTGSNSFLFYFLQLSFDVGILAIFGRLDADIKEELKKNYRIIDKGYNSFPTNIPGTKYYNAVSVGESLYYLF